MRPLPPRPGPAARALARAPALALAPALGSALALALGAGPSAAAAKPVLRVSPQRVHPHQTLRLSGSADDCPVGDRVILLSSGFPRRHFFAGVPSVSAPVRRGGSFALGVTLARGVRPGRYDVSGRCGGGNLGAHASFTVVGASASAYEPRHEQLTSGAITATLAYSLQQSPPIAAGAKLSITRGGRTALSGDDLGAACDLCSGAIPVGGLPGSAAPSLAIRDLAGDGEPEVLVDLFTGGAHCCSITVIYRYAPATGTYTRIAKLWGDPAYQVLAPAPDGGPPLLKTADDRFANAFCAYVCSLLPGQLFRLGSGGLRDVTRHFPQLVSADLADLDHVLSHARRTPSDRFAIKGILPAVCADYYLLGRRAGCDRLLVGAARRGELAPTPARYARRVRRFLRRLGY